MNERVTFVDIDGVLLPRRQWLVPANAEALAAMEQADRARAAALVRFDAAAVALVNRLCDHTGAKVATHSNWRNLPGIDLRQKLLDEGVAERSLHAHPVCPRRGLGNGKMTDIRDWLEAHGADDYVVIDDVVAGGQDDAFVEDCLIQVDPDDGFSVADYRVALTAFGSVDQFFAVPPVAEADLALVMQTLGCGRIPALRWLFQRGATDYASSRAVRLDVEFQLAHFRDHDAFHDDGQRRHEAEKRRSGVLAEIAILQRTEQQGWQG